MLTETIRWTCKLSEAQERLGGPAVEDVNW